MEASDLVLTLTRSPGEFILIGDDIEISVISISRGQVKIGITAPRDVAIRRPELNSRYKSGNSGHSQADTDRD